MEVVLGTGNFVLDGDTAPPPPKKKRPRSPIQFLAHVYCGHGRPSQLLLSSCFLFHVFGDQLGVAQWNITKTFQKTIESLAIVRRCLSDMLSRLDKLRLMTGTRLVLLIELSCVKKE